MSDDGSFPRRLPPPKRTARPEEEILREAQRHASEDDLLSLSFKAGDTVYREGDLANGVYILEAGEVAILKRTDDEEVRVGRLVRGQLFGEIGVIEDARRSVTVQALTDLKVIFVDRTVFRAAFADSNPLTLHLLKLLCRRLNDTDERIAVHLDSLVPAFDDPGAPRVKRTLKFRGATKLVTRQIGDGFLPVEELPFTIGNRYGSEREPIITNHGCFLGLRERPELSAPHFAFEKRNDRFVVHDLGSRDGTLVNGTPISRFGPSGVARLQEGQNIIIAGPIDSPFRFEAVVEEILLG